MQNTTEKSSRSAEGLYKFFIYFVLVLLAVTIIVPVAWVFMASIKQNAEFYGNPWALPAGFYWQNFVNAWNGAKMGEYMLNSVIVTALALVLLLVSPIIFFRPMMAWISSVIGRSGSLRNAWRRTKGNYLRFLAVVFLFNAAAYLVQEADVLSGADSWLAWTLLAPLIIYCNVFLAKSFDFFFLDLDTE